MFEIPKFGVEYSQYDGSRMFTWLADICGLSVDLMNFLVCQILALFFASFFRSYLHTSKVSTNIRHAFGLILGLYFGYICFGQQTIHIVGLPAVCYIIIRTQNPQIVQRLVMIVSLIYLSLVHLHRIYYDYGSYTLDITGPLMIITQKVTLLTFSIHDGVAHNKNELTKLQKCHAIRTLPNALEYFAYTLHFQGLMAGPLVFYKDYIEFIEGTNILKHNTNGNAEKTGNEIIVEPSPIKAVVKKFIGSMVCAYIFMNWVTVYPIKRLADDEFVKNTSMLYKMWYIMIATTIVRFKYYHAWLLADAICNNAGLGFNGYEKDGNPKWDLITNINVISFELATNIRDAINNWNMGTNQWLRMIVYERVPKKYATLLTFSLSALWHGFYAGYYITFVSGALVVTAARSARNLFRHRFQKSETSRVFYDILTVLVTRVFMGYLTFPFILLEFKASARLYLNLCMCLHLVGLITIYLLPHFIQGERRQQKSISKGKNPSNGDVQQNANEIELTTTMTATATSTAKKSLINNVQSNGFNRSDKTIASELLNGNPTNSHNNNEQQFIDNIPMNQCDISKLNTVAQSDVHDIMDIMQTSQNTETNSLNKSSKLSHETIDYRQEIHLSMKIRERIDSETRNFEELIDKTVTGIVELKDDLMRVNNDELHLNSNGISNGTEDGGLRKRNFTDLTNGKEIEIFLRKEINSAVNQVNVLPAVLSNGHAD